MVPLGVTTNTASPYVRRRAAGRQVESYSVEFLLWIEQSGLEPWLRSLCHVLEPGMQMSQCLSTPRSINGDKFLLGHPNKILGATYDEIGSHLGE